MTSSAPAMGGIALADTKDAASIRRSPVPLSASMRQTRSATEMGASFWSPSRGPTSQISTAAGKLNIALQANGRRSLASAPDPDLDRGWAQLEGLADRALDVAQVRLWERARGEQGEGRRIDRALGRVQYARPVLAVERRWVPFLRQLDRAVQHSG